MKSWIRSGLIAFLLCTIYVVYEFFKFNGFLGIAFETGVERYFLLGFLPIYLLGFFVHFSGESFGPVIIFTFLSPFFYFFYGSLIGLISFKFASYLKTTSLFIQNVSFRIFTYIFLILFTFFIFIFYSPFSFSHALLSHALPSFTIIFSLGFFFHPFLLILQLTFFINLFFDLYFSTPEQVTLPSSVVQN